MTQLHWSAGIHHDGSSLYVSDLLPKLGDTVAIRLRTPTDAPITAVFLRTAPDGENHLARMESVEQDATSTYWEVALPISMPRNTYRFKILSDEGAYYLNAQGISRYEMSDYFDFKIVADYATADWLDDAVFYQIFPDRFNNGDASLNHKDGEWTKREFKVQFREWGAPPLPYAQAGNLDFYGGDLPGIQQKIDYLKELGINALYLTPIFTSSSNHRYNIEDFYNVDPHLGGNQALVELNKALHENDMRIILDITPNHVGSFHKWFLEAQRDLTAPTAEYFTFTRHPDEYISWLGVSSLPKLNYTSEALRDHMYRDEDSVFLFWLKPPFEIDGWRMDVYNMTGRQGDVQLGHKVGREIRREIKNRFPNAYLFGEHWFDATPHLQGNELDATMNYQGFNIPMWRWLAGFEGHGDPKSERDDHYRMPTDAFAGQLSHYRAAVPWIIFKQQFNQLCSHDTVRILNIVNGDKRLMRLGVSLLMTYPGVPCIYYGDEIALAGARDPDNRRCMPWHDQDVWDDEMFEFYQNIIRLRKSSPALTHGGYQDLYQAGDIFAFQRHAPEQRLIVVGYRGMEAGTSLSLPVSHAGLADGSTLKDLLSDATYTVTQGMIELEEIAPCQTLMLEEQTS